MTRLLNKSMKHQLFSQALIVIRPSLDISQSHLWLHTIFWDCDRSPDTASCAEFFRSTTEQASQYNVWTGSHKWRVYIYIHMQHPLSGCHTTRPKAKEKTQMSVRMGKGYREAKKNSTLLLIWSLGFKEATGGGDLAPLIHEIYPKTAAPPATCCHLW